MQFFTTFLNKYIEASVMVKNTPCNQNLIYVLTSVSKRKQNTEGKKFQKFGIKKKITLKCEILCELTYSKAEHLYAYLLDEMEI